MGRVYHLDNFIYLCTLPHSNKYLCYHTAGKSEEKVESEEIPIPSDEGKGEGGFFISHSRG